MGMDWERLAAREPGLRPAIDLTGCCIDAELWAMSAVRWLASPFVSFVRIAAGNEPCVAMWSPDREGIWSDPKNDATGSHRIDGDLWHVRMFWADTLDAALYAAVEAVLDARDAAGAKP